MGQGSSVAEDCPKECTDAQINKLSYEWTIKNFSDVPSFLQSSAFWHPDDDKPKWRLELHPYDLDNELTVHRMSLYLHLLSDIQVRAKFKFILINAKRRPFKEIETVCDFNPEEECWGWRNIPRDLLCNIRPEGDLTVRCQVTVLMNGRDNQFSVPDSSMTSDLAQLLHTQKFADCVIEIEGQEIKAHKNLLSARSPVFSAMFEHETQETQSGRVVVVDVDFAVMEELVHFIYTDDAPNLDGMSERLLVVADKYQLERLQAMCAANLWKRLDVDNVCETLVLADLHSAKQLEDETIKFINSNANDVTQTQGWEAMNKYHPHLLGDIVS